MTPEEQKTMNDMKRDFNISGQSKHPNRITIHPSESPEHFMAKCHLCYLLFKKKIPFETEFKIPGMMGKFNIPDILIFNIPSTILQAIEIMHSESEDEYLNKIKKSKDGIFFMKIKSDQALKITDIGELL